MTSGSKIVKLPALKKKIAQARREGRVIAFTNGCFDIVHFGHVSYLQKAKRGNRVLIVGLNSDVSVKLIKGPHRPINPQRERAGVLAALACVDFVIVFKEETPIKLIESIAPDVLVKGADWRGKKVAGSECVLARGGKVEYVRYLPGLSSTRIIERIRAR